MSPIPNRRKHPRSSSYIIAKYTVIEGTFRDVIKNISAGGLSLETRRKIAIGQPISIELPLFTFNNLGKVTGRVVWKDSVGFAVTFNEAIHGLICREGRLPKIVHGAHRHRSRK